MRHFPLFVLCLVLGSCERSQPAVTDGTSISGGFLLPPPGAEAPAAAPARRIVRHGELRFLVADLATAHAEILRQVDRHDGYVGADAMEQVAGSRRSVVTVRVPAARFDSFVATVGELGTLEHKQLDAADVTTQWIDLDARLTAKRTLEQRCLELIARAANVAEVLEVERELGKVRGDVESMTAQLRSLDDRIAMSTLTITCRQVQGTDTVVTAIGEALVGGWRALVRVFVTALFAWPLLVFAALVVAWRLRHRSARLPSLPAGA